MYADLKKTLLFHLKYRTYISEPQYYVSKILETYGAGQWTRACLDRLARELRIDGKHVQIDFFSGDILMDLYGVESCEDILTAYIGDNYDDVWDIVRNNRRFVQEKNIFLASCRRTSKHELSDVIASSLGETEPKELLEFVKTELLSRKWYWKAYLKIKDHLDTYIFRLKYIGTIRFVRTTLKECAESIVEEDLRDSPKRTRDDIMEGAYYRFIRKHIKIDKLSGDDLKKYVFLGVNHFKKRRWGGYHHPISGEQARQRFEEILPLMKAVGRLTPLELMQIFRKRLISDEGVKNLVS
ncbi:MAG TPA: hypothetical protein DCZ40_12190, partial [Lachnospiraceae bacterium]|nr:hypothetical protein [Lachnospiraceae bacterium]